MTNLTQDQWVTKIIEDKNAVIIDARRPEEWAGGIQENAIMMNIIDLDTFIEKAHNLDKFKNYYVYCRSGVRSVKACNVLENSGFKTTYNLLGGMLEWKGNTVIP